MTRVSILFLTPCKHPVVIIDTVGALSITLSRILSTLEYKAIRLSNHLTIRKKFGADDFYPNIGVHMENVIRYLVSYKYLY